MRIIRFIVGRAAVSALLLLLLSAITFAIFFAIPADPGRIFFAPGAPVTDAELARVNRALGTDRPKVVQYVDFLRHAVRGDLGTAWLGASITRAGELEGAAVTDTLIPALRITGSLALGGAVLILLIAVPLGMAAASRPNTWLDRAAIALALVAVSTHPLVVGLILRTLAVDRLDFAPVGGYCPFFGSEPVQDAGVFAAYPEVTARAEVCGGPLDWAHHLLLPWITFAAFFVALYMRIVRAQVLEVLREPYVRTARAKGAREWRVLGRHALRNAAAPVVTMIAMDVGMALGIAIYVETIFALPGLGHLALTALAGQAGYDRPVIVGIVLVTGVAIIVLNLLADLVAGALDPRVRHGEAARAGAETLRRTA